MDPGAHAQGEALPPPDCGQEHSCRASRLGSRAWRVSWAKAAAGQWPSEESRDWKPLDRRPRGDGERAFPSGK